MWEEFLNQVQAWAPAVIASSVGLVLVILTDRVMRRRHRAKVDTSSGVLGPLLSSTLVAITLIVIALALPISEAARGQLLGLLGLLATAAIALSPTTFLGNAMAGIMLRAIGSFRAGDFVRVGDYFGRVSDKSILHTEIQTEDRDLTTLPNLYLITHPLTVVRTSGTVVSATISLGYDVSHVLVEEHLTKAATRAGLSDPFVQVLELGDNSITYRTAGFLTDIKLMLTTRSNLRRAMLDCLHEAKIEIVSPSFVNLRRLSEEDAILPETMRKVPTVIKQDPALRIFDKADAAEAKSKIEDEVEAQKAVITALRQTHDRSEFAAEKTELETELAIAEARLDSLKLLVAEPVEPDP